MVAGEASGDILGAGLIAALRQHYPDLVVEGVGGPRMQDAGMVSFYPLDRLSVMGLVDPLKRLPELLRMRRNRSRARSSGVGSAGGDGSAAAASCATGRGRPWSTIYRRVLRTSEIGAFPSSRSRPLCPTCRKTQT